MEEEDTKQLPAVIPVFPLPGVLLLPTIQLPLNIFEPRYLAMFNDALAGNRYIGMIQPSEVEADPGTAPLYPIGCVGRISSSSETDDGRMLVTLTGISRFRIKQEIVAITPTAKSRPIMGRLKVTKNITLAVTTWIGRHC